MSWWPYQKIGGVYIPPSDSPYFNSVQHGALASHTVSHGDVIVMSDFNGRVGQPHLVDEAGCVYLYDSVKDRVMIELGSYTCTKMYEDQTMALLSFALDIKKGKVISAKDLVESRYLGIKLSAQGTSLCL
ncbi:hypothetical protein E2C01_048415 [Portunus trituberculatus]|uniref:Uncharacterized protein n=1 Tax=Portunus trituberculatus TaxID=210409 RepID=A0A5B7GAH7_PORTR|nr:hypothetical protein [Portunus trituberculatus]